MKQRLLWKLLLINIVPVIAIIILVVWLAIDQLAASYFMALMDKYAVSPNDIHQMFLTAVHRYLLWATILALALAFIISYFLIRRVLRPLSQMHAITREVAVGNFSARLDVTSQDEVGELGIAFNRMADSLEQVEKLRKTMVADVAHELRTPLTNLRGYLEALNDEVLPPSRETFTMLQQEIMRLVSLVENLQQLARADAARAFLKREKLSLGEVADQILSLYELQFQEKEISIEKSIVPEAEFVMADRDKLLQAIRNLVENASKYTPENGRIAITTERVPDAVRFAITNSGPGIKDSDLPFIFERFFRADRSRARDGGGAGIGLAIVRELIEAHGGNVGAESRDGETLVWFSLPV
ncbi:MAG: HAMP domain-containing protein [Deltaproteobacteria bacterium]|jgi:signal transduction histidine kinase|nr:HAMP domain-containing protein [Deltaproteobacteria bacterium]